MSEFIKREAVMQAFADYVWNSNHSDLVPPPRWNDAVNIVRDIPAVDAVEVQRGRWKGAGMGDYYCSLCQQLVGERSNYCPNCGAKMDGGEDHDLSAQ